jgi:hypothetical protein
MTKVEILNSFRETTSATQMKKYEQMTYDELLEMYWDVNNPARINEGV